MGSLLISADQPTLRLDALWKSMTKKQKVQLLRARGLSTSWAETKTVKEMVKRGGGMAANSLLELVRLHAKENPADVLIDTRRRK